ncbi:MAG: phosphate acyltransferase PlsX [Alphaproteobacteria bacterium]|nr:phosphate acyltransferase PlsX [Alphaproteobacteria bacterium]
MTLGPVALDAMGGDGAPETMISGAVAAVRQGLDVVVVGDPERLAPLIPAGVSLPIEPAAGVVSMDSGRVAAAVRATPEPSVSVAMRMVREGRACAAVSCGHTGATMAAGLFRLGRLAGVERPAVTMVVPRTDGGRLVVLDLGANVDCRPSQLLQFALMGHAYAQGVAGLPSPRVGLLSNGEEPGKGDERVREAGELIAAFAERSGAIRFVGNVEPLGAFRGDCDVLVCDGFVGNVMLKTVEATAEVVTHIVREEILKTTTAKAGAWLLRPALRRVRERTDYSSQGGALLLGVDGVVVVGHGRSDATAVRSALQFARHCAADDLPRKVLRALERLPENPAD